MIDLSCKMDHKQSHHLAFLHICGSSRIGSANQMLIEYFKKTIDGNHAQVDLQSLPLFDPNIDKNQYDENISHWLEMIDNADIILICTPEYLQNIPACIKSALEWTNAVSALSDKKVFPIVLTPKAPSGNKAMEALIQSLKSLNAKIPAHLILHHDDFQFNGNVIKPNEEIESLFSEFFQLF